MAMRSRGGAAASRRSRAGIHPVYEDFKAMSEWKHEEEAVILLYHLPGFVKEQIRIIAENKGMRVRGEHFIAGNKWRRFEEEVMVPEECNMSEVRAKFENGTLQIIMPKKKTTTPKKYVTEEQSNANQESTKPSLKKPDLQPKSIKETQEVEQRIQPPPLLPLKSPSEPKPKSSHEGPSPRATLSTDHPKQTQRSEDKILPRKAFYDKVTTIKDQEAPKDTRDDIKAKENEYQEVVTSLIKENENKRMHKGAIPSVNKKTDEVYADVIGELKGKIEPKESHGFEDYKRAIKSHLPRRCDEDRQHLMNMGVAILVIMALGAHISYSFGSSGKSRD